MLIFSLPLAFKASDILFKEFFQAALIPGMADPELFISLFLDAGRNPFPDPAPEITFIGGIKRNKGVEILQDIPFVAGEQYIVDDDSRESKDHKSGNGWEDQDAVIKGSAEE